MKVLFVTYFYPPINAVATQRTKVIAETLHKLNILGKVLTAKPNQLLTSDIQTTVPLDSIVRSQFLDYSNLDKSPKLAKASWKKRIQSILAKMYVPDGKILWFPTLVKEMKSIIQSEKIDAILVSAGPFTAALAAAYVSRQTGIPLVVDLRDPWADNPLNRRWPIFQQVNQWLERYSLKQASALCTVSEPLVQLYQRKYQKPTYCIYNGYTEESFAGMQGQVNSHTPLTIRYLGQIYDGQDVKTLLDAIQLLGPQAKDWLRIELYSVRIGVKNLELLRQANSPCIHIMPLVPHKQALQLMLDADALLVLLFRKVPFDGPLTKVFEYLRSEREILCVGEKESHPALFYEQHFGLSTCDQAEDLAKWLDMKHQEKNQKGHVARSWTGEYRTFERYDQMMQIEQVLQNNVHP